MKTKWRWYGIGLLAGMLLWTGDARAEEKPTPEAIITGMSMKLFRGLTNVVTCPAELPKQIYKVGRDQKAVDYAAAPLAGIGMILYRAGFGAVEAVTFLIPTPGFYAPLCVPAYVWQDWERKVVVTPQP